MQLLRRRRALILVSLALALAAVPAAFAASGSGATRLPTGTGYSVRPAVVFLGGSGGAAFGGARRPGHPLGHIAWHSWGATNAYGQAAYLLNNCKPDCARGKYIDKGQVKLHAWHAEGGLFTRLTASGAPVHHTYKWHAGWY